MQMTLIQYVGKQRVKPDNVRRSGRVWRGYGAVVEVPVSEKFSYLAHPGEWREVKEGDIKAVKQAQVSVESIKTMLSNLDVSLLMDVQMFVDELVNRKDVEAQAKQVVAPVEATGKPLDSTEAAEDAGALRTYQYRIERIAAAIRDLDPKNEEHYTQSGVPRVRAVRDNAIGVSEITAEEIQEALKLVQ